MAVQKDTTPVPYKPLCSPSQSFPITANKGSVSAIALTGRGIVFPGCRPQVVVEQLHCKRVRTPRWWWRQRRWRWRLIESRVSRQTFTQWRTADECPPRCKLAFFQQDQLVTQPAYLLLHPGVLLCLFKALRVSWSNSDSYSCFLVWTVAMLLMLSMWQWHHK